MIWGICKSRIKVVRNTDEIASEAAAASISITRQPSIDTTVQVTLSADATGTITVTGELNGSAQTATLTFTSSKVDVSFKEFDTVTTLACSSGLVSAGVTVTAIYITTQGGDVTSQYTVVDDWPASFVRAKPYGQTNYITNDAGAFEIERGMIVTPYVDTWSPRTGDVVILKETNKQFQVEGIALIQTGNVSQHWEMFMSKVSQSIAS